MKKPWILPTLFISFFVLISTGCDSTDTDTQTPDTTAETGSDDEPADDESNDSEEEEYLIADHSVVDSYDDIPAEYIDIVKTWLVDAAGESHSEAYRDGMDALMALDSTYAVETFAVWNANFPEPSSDALRIGRHDSVGEEDFWTNESARDEIKAIIADQHDTDNPIHVLFQAWCWDLTRTTGPAGSGTDEDDEEYGCHWFGSSSDGPDGDHIWGLDSSDEAITGNSVSLQTYLDTIDEYNSYCEENGYSTTAVFTTGPVDGQASSNEQGYQRYVKHEAIREHVQEGNNRVLFDYADILAYNDNGDRHMESWQSPYNDTTCEFPAIHPDNDAEDTGHIADEGALRLAKAMWWMLARMAGWDGSSG